VGRGERFAARVADAPLLDIVWERDVEAALALELASFDVCVLDAGEGDAGDGDAGGGSAREGEAALAAVRGLRARSGCPPLLVRLDRDGPAVAALCAAGAADVIVRAGAGSDDADADILARLHRLAHAGKRAPEPDAAPPAFEGIVGASAPLQRVFALAARASLARATVLLLGETGTGKELVARAIHRAGPRRARAFVAVNCAAFPDTLLESELFGHVRGAFTGAERDKQGLFEVADGGTLFLDEVGETSGPFQAKLLRALQEREVRPVGGSRSRAVDVRVVAATNRDLWRESSAGGFRQDLYFRLAVFPIEIPPLRERASDVVHLARHFLVLHGRAEAKPGVQLSPEAERLLEAHPWPGNVRELENEIQRALALAEPGETLRPEHFSERLASILPPIQASLRPGDTLRETLDRIEAWLIREALAAHAGRRAQTARHLGVTREGLYKKMQRLGIG
jgi:transcriptional regulator with PAS, ATPase and Fis domain